MFTLIKHGAEFGSRTVQAEYGAVSEPSRFERMNLETNEKTFDLLSRFPMRAHSSLSRRSTIVGSTVLSPAHLLRRYKDRMDIKQRRDRSIRGVGLDYVLRQSLSVPEENLFLVTRVCSMTTPMVREKKVYRSRENCSYSRHQRRRDSLYCLSSLTMSKNDGPSLREVVYRETSRLSRAQERLESIGPDLASSGMDGLKSSQVRVRHQPTRERAMLYEYASVAKNKYGCQYQSS